MKRTMTIMIAGLTAIFALGACGAASDAVSNGAKGAIESATGCKVNGADSKNTKVECKGKGKNGQGSFSVGTGSLPDGFPKGDVPLPAGKIVSSISTDVNGKAAYNVTVKVDGKVSDAANSYKSALKDKGFVLDEAGSFSLGGDGGLVAFQAKGTVWDVNVVGAAGATADSNGLVITVTSHDSTTDTTTST